MTLRGIVRVTLAVALVATLALAVPTPGSAAPLPAAAGRFVADELLVRFHDEFSDDDRAAIFRALGITVLDVYPSSGVVRLRVARGSLEEAQRQLLAADFVEFAEPNYHLHVAQVVPADPRYAEQQAAIYRQLDGPGAWHVSTGSRDVVVALVDGAVDLDHPDLAANIWTNPGEVPGNGEDDDGNGFIDDVHGYDFVGDWAGDEESKSNEDPDPDAKPGDPALGDGQDQDHDGVPDDAYAHGTQVAGVLAAVGDNGIGIAGAAWKVAIMPLRIMNPEGTGRSAGLVAALDYATRSGADVVNVSLTASEFPAAARAAIDAATDAGLIVVAAAGNNGGAVAFPAALPNVIAVGSAEGQPSPADAVPVEEEKTDTTLTTAAAFGPTLFTPVGPEIEFVAPGVEVPTTSVSSTGEPEYGFATGTSFSAPFITGTIVLILAVAPVTTLPDVRTLLQAGSEDLPDADRPNWDGGERGGGLINMGLTLQTFAAQVPAAPLLVRAEVVGDDVEIEGQAEAESAVTIFVDAAAANAATTGVTDGASVQIAASGSGVPLTVADADEPSQETNGSEANGDETNGDETDGSETDSGSSAEDPPDDPADPPTDEPDAALPAGAIARARPDESGHFSVTISLAAFDETAAVVAITAAASRRGAVSPPSAPVVLALPLDVDLVEGWNLVGWAGAPSSSTDIFAGLPARVLRLYTWDGSAWARAVSGNPLFQIDEIRTGQGLWILVGPGPPMRWRQTRAPFDPARIGPGWQFIAWVGAGSDIAPAAASASTHIEAILAWDAVNQSFRVFYPRLPTLGTLDRLDHFQGVWVFLEEGRSGVWPAASS